MTEREHDGTTLRVAIGQFLAHERKKADMTIREVGEAIGYDHAYVHKTECGELGSEAMLKKLDDLFGLDGTLSTFAYVARKGVIEEYGTRVAERESRAARIQVCNSSAVPSLLRTEDYARELLRTEWPKGPVERIESELATKLKRQAILNKEDPPIFWSLVDESALKRQIGSKQVMHAQLVHVLKTCERPNVTFQVLPFSSGPYWAMGGSLTLITSAKGRSIAYVESFGSGELVDSARRVIDLAHKFDITSHKALSEDDSIALVAEYAKGYE